MARLDEYFFGDDLDFSEYVDNVESARQLLSIVGVVHIPTTNNITFRCKKKTHSIGVALAVIIEEDYPQKYSKVCCWYVEYGKFFRFIRNVY